MLRIYELGTLFVRGSAEDPVVFDSVSTSPKPCDWQGLRFLCCSHELRHLEIRNAGKNAQYRNADIVAGEEGTTVTLENVKLLNGANWGILVEDKIATISFGPDTYIDPHPLGPFATYSFQITTNTAASR